MAGGTAAAVQRPRIPPKTLEYNALLENPAMRHDMEKAPMLNISKERRPNVSATFAKKRRKAPEAKLS